MSSVIALPNLREGYIDLCKHVLRTGVMTRPRGQKTFELENATITVDDLFRTLPVGVNRRPNLMIGALEALQLIGGHTRPDLMVAASPPMQAFTEADGNFYGAYGARNGKQVQSVITKLKMDRDSRQAVMTLWDPRLDNEMWKSDYPCTIGMGFRIRDHRLNMSVIMRSNDVWLGAAYDIFQFTQLQWTIATYLDIEPGTYSHHVWSLHVYERDAVKIEQLAVEPGFEDAALDCLDGLRAPARALWLLDRPDDLKDPSSAEEWYAGQVRKAYEKKHADETELG